MGQGYVCLLLGLACCKKLPRHIWHAYQMLLLLLL